MAIGYSYTLFLMPELDHIGIAVKSIAQARKLYESLGLTVVHEETVEQEQVRTAMIPTGEARIELLEPTSETSPVARFLAKRGEGLHHVALHVENISAALETLKAQGARLISDDIQIGAGGHLYFFVHPSSTGGVLLEICQDSVSDV
ncbi:MAG TPA: methylmalonyl-CoA epimerase [Acidobacteriaceae bacterium]